MRNIKECLRLKLEAGLSHEKIARALQLSKGVAANTSRRCAWPAGLTCVGSRLVCADATGQAAR
jgi:hypothetical protein